MRARVAALMLMLGILASCGGRDARFQQYFVQGEKLYEQHCSNCHQKNGQGLGRVYPPVHSSDFMQQNFNEVICLMKYGMTGEVVVNGVAYNQAMPGVAALTPLELAAIATYIYNSGEHARGLVEQTEVSAALQTCQE
jgi:cytochrome c551